MPDQLKNRKQCQGCDRDVVTERITLNDDGLCWSCEILQRVERQKWFKCRGCNKEFGKLFESGLCLQCETEKDEKAKEKEKSRDRLVDFMGGKYAAECFTFQKFQPSEGTMLAYNAAQNFNFYTENLYLCGSVGVGKTHLAYAIARKWFLDGRRIFLGCPLDLLAEVKSKKHLEERANIEKMSALDMLVIDELGVRSLSDPAIEVLCSILDKRKRKGMNGIVITSNLNLDDLASQLKDDRVASRLCGMCDVIEMTGTDWRLRRGA